MKTDSLFKVLSIVVNAKAITEAELLNKPDHNVKLDELNTVIELLKQQGFAFTFQNGTDVVIMPTNEGFRYVENCRGNHF